MQAVGFEKDEWNPHPLVSKATDSSYTLMKRDVCEKNQFLQQFKHVQTFCALANMKVDESANVVKIEDLGSGLYIKEKDLWFIGGVISKASATDQIVVFTDVYHYLDWINSHTTIFAKSSD